jgi:hypothetical protein
MRAWFVRLSLSIVLAAAWLGLPARLPVWQRLSLLAALLGALVLAAAGVAALSRDRRARALLRKLNEGDLQGCLLEARRLEERALAANDATARAGWRIFRAAALYDFSQLEDAYDALRSLQFDRLRGPVADAYAYQMGCVLAQRGAWESAAPLLETLEGSPRRYARRVLAPLLEAELAFARGDCSRACDAIQRGLGALHRHIRHPNAPMLELRRCELLARCGHTEIARELLSALAQRAPTEYLRARARRQGQELAP